MSSQDAGDSTITRSSFTSQHEEEVAEHIRQVYVDGRYRFLDVGPDARFSSTTAQAAGIAADQVRSTIDYQAWVEPVEYFACFMVRRGDIRIESTHHTSSAREGDARICPAGTPVAFTFLDASLAILRLPWSAIEEAAAGLAQPHSPVRFEGVEPVSGEMRRYWGSTLALIHTALMNEPSPMAHPLLAQEAARMTALAALHTFPNSTMRADGNQKRPLYMAPSALRRATDFIEAQADRPITLSDIADASGTDVLSLQHHFHRLHGTTPLTYLRRIRLGRAHDELISATEPTEAMVEEIALRCGFANVGRFLTDYQERYGTAPGQESDS